MSTTPILELPDGLGLPQAVTDELNMRLLWIGKQLTVASTSTTSATPTIIGTRNQRLNVAAFAAQSYPGQQFYETDTTLTYISRPIVTGGAGYIWAYLSGNTRGTYAGLLTNLGSLDTGLLYTITDKNRTLRWSGSAWTFAPWEVFPVGFVAGFDSSPGTGWHICDGSIQSELHADGTLHSVTLKDFTTAAYPKWGPTFAGAGAAVKPLITGNTGAGTAHHHGVSAVTATATGTAAVTVVSAAGVSVAAQAHTHSLTGNTDDESTHTHPVGTLVNDALGEPLHYGLIAYQRT